MVDRIEVTPRDFSLAGEYAELLAHASDAGGIVLFVGRVRPDDADNPVVALELEHYPAMTEQALHQLVAEARKRWTLEAVTVLHRVGRIAVDEQIVLVAVAAGHRDEAYRASRFLIDKLKTTAPFWKKEHRADGTCGWVAAKASDGRAASGWD